MDDIPVATVPPSYPIPVQLRIPDMRFIKVAPRGKTPVERDWQNTKNYPWDDPELVKWIVEGGNYGVLPRGGISIIDLDDISEAIELDLLKSFEDTFTVKTSKGIHIYISIETTMPKIPFFSKENNQIHIGEFYGNGSAAFVVGSGSVHPSGSIYSVSRDIPIKQVHSEYLNIKLFSLVKFADTSKKETFVIDREYPVSSLSNELNLRVESYLYPTNAKHLGNGEVNGEHPTHGSTTGTNFSINTMKNVWHCWRCGTGGDALLAYAVRQGYIECSDCVTGYQLPKEIFLRVLDELKPAPKQEIAPITKEEIASFDLKTNPRLTFHLEESNFITRYVNLMKQRTDAYEEYHFAGALTILSALAQKAVEMTMCHGTIYTNFFLFLIGLSSVSKKTTAINFTSDTLDHDNVIPYKFYNSCTPEGIIDGMTQTPRTFMLVDEASGFLNDMNKKGYMSSMREKLCALYECQTFSHKLRKEILVVKDPYLTALWGTTPDSFEKSANVENLTSGLFYRYLWFFPDYQKETRPMKPSTPEIERARVTLKNEIGNLWEFYKSHADNPIKFHMTEELYNKFNDWIIKRSQEIQQTKNEMHASLFGRLQIYVLKLAMVFEMGSVDFDVRADAGEATISEEHLLEAIRLVDEYFLPMGMIICRIVEESAENNVFHRIIKALEHHGNIIQRDALARATRIKSKELDEYIRTMIDDMDILEERIITDEVTKRTRKLYIYKPAGGE